MLTNSSWFLINFIFNSTEITLLSKTTLVSTEYQIRTFNILLLCSLEWQVPRDMKTDKKKKNFPPEIK